MFIAELWQTSGDLLALVLALGLVPVCNSLLISLERVKGIEPSFKVYTLKRSIY